MDLGHLLSVARRRWLMLVAFVAAGAVLGVAHTELTPPTYRSTSSVFFSLDRTQTVGELAQGSTYLEGLVQSYAQIATSQLVLDPVIGQLGLEASPTQLARLVKAEPRPNTAILDIEVSYDSPEQAAWLANALGAQLRQAVATLSPRSSARGASVTVSTISLAAVPTRPAAPRPAVDLGAGLAAGLLLGVAVAMLVEAMASPVSTGKAAEAVTDAPVLASVGRHRRRDRLPVVTDPRSPRAESFWMLRTNIDAQRRSADAPMCLVVVSALPAEGCTSVAVNLAIAMSHTAHRVLLIDADLRRPAVAGLLGVDASDGLSSVLRGVSSLEEAVCTWVSPDQSRSSLAVLPTSPVLTNPSELIASEALDKLLDMVRQRYDMVILDSPPLLRSVDGAVLAARADGALLVVDSRTRQKRLAEAVDRLRLAGASVIGVVLERASRRRTSSYRRPRWAFRRPRWASR